MSDAQTPPTLTPFIIENRQEDRTPSGAFRPAARLVLTPALRTEGLWAALAPEDFKNLLLIFTFLAPNGWCRPSLVELATAMNVSQGKARGRLQRLMQTEWQGRPLVTALPRPDGLDAYAPGRQIFAEEQIAPSEAPPVALPATAGWARVVTASRERYARTREEVERDIAERMGWDRRTDTPPDFAGEDPAVVEGKRRAYGRMAALGVLREQALDLLARFPLEQVERQLAWIGLRRAKSPGRYLVAAIENDYEAPFPVRRREAIAALSADAASDVDHHEQWDKEAHGEE